jgi:LEA14-like dessication related protein
MVLVLLEGAEEYWLSWMATLDKAARGPGVLRAPRVGPMSMLTALTLGHSEPIRVAFERRRRYADPSQFEAAALNDSVRLLSLLLLMILTGCAGLPNRDPLFIDVAGIEPLPGEGMELNLAVSIRIQNPNDLPVEYTGVALQVDLNGRSLASGVSDRIGTVPRYGERCFAIPVTISAFDVARQIFAYLSAENQNEVHYRVRGKLEGGFFGTRRFSDEGSFTLPQPMGSVPR